MNSKFKNEVGGESESYIEKLIREDPTMPVSKSNIVTGDWIKGDRRSKDSHTHQEVSLMLENAS